ncbi:HAMP domain-containing histidine kinase [Clostridium perfringens]|uniref:sensor histidine kinase n=1 Tax=Clostridium perfringens TaxID=1502 RepID=UPI001F42B129|nr:HAMP domain-containing sensor histidine kinase [Clostridium perfringens]MCF2686892.1 HAMP domain-containing histidine kinase [Clostridium perfringens]
MFCKKIELKIKSKIVITSILIFIPIIICVCTLTFKILKINLLNSTINSLTADSKYAQIYIENIINENRNKNINSSLETFAPYICNELKELFGFRTQFFNTSQELLADTNNTKDIYQYNKDIVEASKGNKAYIIEDINGVPNIFISSPVFYNNEPCGVIRFIFKDTPTYTIVKNSFYTVLIVALIFVIIGIFLFYTFAKKITLPLIKLTDYSKKISKGNYSERIHIESGDETEVLANTFNEMSENINIYINEIKKSQKNQKEFFDNISHEFRTPLTSIIGYSYVIPELKNEKQLKESSDCIRAEGERLLGLVNEILTIAKNEKESFQIANEFINLRKILDECISTLKPRLDKYHIIVENYCAIHFSYGDYNKTKQVFLNILDNAIKYSGCEVITISSNINRNSFEVIIKDDGIGFDTENPETKDGHGFGLNICKDIMKKQNGDFLLESKLYEGTTCKIIFYKHSSN